MQIINIIEVLVVIVPLLLSVAYVTIAERKIMGSMQRRLGPNKVGYYGLLQPFADAVKLIVKETVIPLHANSVLFFLGPIITLIFALLGWAVIPFGPGLTIIDFSLGIIYSIAISSLGVYGILIAGWAANSKYAFVGALRSSAQLISYELILSTAIVLVILLTGSLNMTNIIQYQQTIWYIFPLLPIFIIFLIGALAETNRAPFDLPEAESELVAGFMTEHSAVIFVFFFLAEYGNIILISTITTILFLGGYQLPASLTNIFPLFNIPVIQGLIYGLVLGFKVSLIVFVFIWIRASFPRIRYDQLMSFAWKVLLPILIAFTFLIPSILISFDILPT